MARRSRIDIVLDVLRALDSEGPMPPTRLATKANLPYDRLVAVLDRLESRGLVRIRGNPSTERGRLVEVTRKGREVLRELLRLKGLLEDLGLA